MSGRWIRIEYTANVFASVADVSLLKHIECVLCPRNQAIDLDLDCDRVVFEILEELENPIDVFLNLRALRSKG